MADPNALVFYVSMFIAVSGFILSVATNRSKASREELESLRQTINTLLAENARLSQRSAEQDKQIANQNERITELERENKELKEQLNRRRSGGKTA